MAKPHQPDRREVRPEHLLRAVLDDGQVGHALVACGTTPQAMRATLEHRWLATVDDIDVETLFELGIDVETVLVALNPPFDDEPDWQGRTLSPEARDVLVKALVESSGSGRRVHAGHVLLGLMHSRDPVLIGTFREHGVRAKAVRELVRRWDRQAG